MKFLLTTIFLVFLSTLGFSQSADSTEKHWRKIRFDIGPKGTSYTIDRKNLEMTITSDSTKVKTTVDSTLIHQLFQSIENGMNYQHSNSLNTNYNSWDRGKSERIWFTFSQHQFDERSNEIAINTLQNFDWNQHKKRIEEYRRHYSSESRFLIIAISYLVDSAAMGSQFIFSKTPFIQYELNSENKDTAFSSLDIYPFLQDLFQFSKPIENQKAFFDELQCFYTFNAAINDSINSYWLALVRKRDKRSMKLLERSFTVQEAYISKKPTIDWGHRKSARLLLNTSDYHIYYSLISDYSMIFNAYDYFSPHDFVIKHSSYRGKLKVWEDSLLPTPIIDYCKNTYRSKGIIHYVRNHSLSFKARRDFKHDFKATGQDKNLYKGKLKHALLFELQEAEHEDLKYHEKLPNVSYWVFLEDGTIILWQSSGDKIMNFPKEFVSGAVCKVISKEEFKSYGPKKPEH